MFRPFFTTIFRGSSAVLYAVTIPPADLRSLSLYYYAVCGRMCMSSVCVWCSCLLLICLWVHKQCLVFLSVGDLLVSSQAVFGVLVCWWSACEFTSSVWCSCLLVILDAKQARLHNSFKNTKCKLLQTNAAIWFNKMCGIKQRSPTDKDTKHAQMTYTCGHILRNNTNSTNTNQREEQ